MTYSEFEKKLFDARIICSGQTEIYKDWTTGGRTGGGWDRDNDEDTYRPREVEPEPNFDELDKILELFYPSIGFLEYKALVRELVVVTEHEIPDWYGNNEEYSRKEVNLKELYNYLVKNGWISGH